MEAFTLMLQHILEKWELKRIARKKNPYLVGIELNTPMLKDEFLTFIPSGQTSEWCIRLFVKGRDDSSTDRIFSRKISF